MSSLLASACLHPTPHTACLSCLCPAPTQPLEWERLVWGAGLHSTSVPHTRPTQVSGGRLPEAQMSHEAPFRLQAAPRGEGAALREGEKAETYDNSPDQR